MALDATIPPVRVPLTTLTEVDAELALERARRPGQRFGRADLLRLLLHEAMDARRQEGQPVERAA